MKTKQGYKARRLPYLPLDIVSPKGQKLQLDYIQDEEFQAGYDLIQEAAKDGDNVGLDEFVDVESYEFLLLLGHCFVVFPTNTEHAEGAREIKALVVIRPQLYCATLDQPISEIHIFLSPALRRDDHKILALLVQTAEKLTLDLDLGFVACTIQVALPCLNWILVLRDLGYMIVASFPYAVNYRGQGLVESCLLYKQLIEGERKKRPSAEVLDMAESKSPNEDEYRKSSLPTFSFLPQEYRLKDGTNAILRNHRHDDDVNIFELFKGASLAGTGFGSDEIISFKFFRFIYMMQYKICVVEEKDTGQILGAVTISKTMCSRTNQEECADASIVLHPKHRKRGVGADLVRIVVSLPKEEGYKHLITQTILINAPVRSLMKVLLRPVTIGLLPGGAHISGTGWADSLFHYFNLENAPSFKEVCSQVNSRL